MHISITVRNEYNESSNIMNKNEQDNVDRSCELSVESIIDKNLNTATSNCRPAQMRFLIGRVELNMLK